MKKVLVDTSFIIAYAILSDSQHNKSIDLKDVLLNEDCYITNGVLNECITVGYNKSKSLEIANDIYYTLIDNFKIINEYEINDFNDITLSVFNKHKGKLSFIDSSLIVVMSRYNLDYLLTFDTQFSKEESIDLLPWF